MRPRPILAPLRLIGAGTPLVESLEHFGARIGYAHNVTPPQVLTLARNVARQLRYGTRVRSYNYSTVCGYGPFSAALVAALERLTGHRGLSGATLGPLRKVLTESLSGCFHNARRWCPECYRREPSERYDLLAWQLITVSHCPLDGCRLESACRRCGLTQPDFRAVDVRQLCHTCRADLGHAPTVGDAPTPWELWSNAASLDLLEFTAQAGPAILGNPFGEFLTQLRVSDRLPPDCNLASFKAFTWKAQHNRPRLQTIFQYAALNCVMPLQVLLDPVGAASPTLPLAESVVTPPPKSTKVHGWQMQLLLRAAAVAISFGPQWDLPLPGWLSKAFGCARPSWRAADPDGYRAYQAAFRGTARPPAIERRTYDVAVRLVEAGLAEGGTATVASIRQQVQAHFPRASPATIAQALSRGLLVVGLMRQMCPDRPVGLKLNRERAGKPRREQL